MIQAEKLVTLKRFRIISLVEGISMIVLLFIAMPLKYGFDMPLMVKYVGWIHGILFMLYILVLIPTSRTLKWSFLKTLIGLAASVLPFGPFLFDRKLKKEEQLMQH
ncbi:MAG TPA: DUF3817 domain-containing protein [Cyclobacteriaceae bacterium]|nr:DUF3817 domain-containing protein [Cyclobacteriaceae bacterium]